VTVTDSLKVTCSDNALSALDRHCAFVRVIGASATLAA